MNSTILYANDFFKVETCDDCYIPGHLIIRPFKQVNSLTQLPAAALENLGIVIALSQSILQTVLEPRRIYTLSFCEVLPIVHFHLFPRSDSLGAVFKKVHQTDVVNGAMFFNWAKDFCKEKPVDYDEMIEAIRLEFRKPC